MSFAGNKYLFRICCLLLGLVFLFSAVSKAWDAEAFADMLLRFGPQWFSVWAPIIILIESALGIMFLLRIHPRSCAVVADLFLIVVSVVFAFGWLARGITDCGCFGVFSTMLDGKPYMTFVRNAILIGVSVPILYYDEDLDEPTPSKLLITLLATAMICFVSGLSMRRSFMLPRLSMLRTAIGEAGTVDKLKKIYPFSADSTYYVYLFSYTCPHCLNSFANVQQYEQFHVVDKVVGIAVDNPEAQMRFDSIYHPQIEIRNLPKAQMESLTGRLPVGLLLKHNTIVKTEGGFISSPGLNIE